MNILILDDSEILRKGLTEMLKENQGINKIDNFSFPNNTKEFFPSLEYDIIIIDIKSKNGINIDFLGHLKSLYPISLIVVFTDFENRGHREICLNKGADIFYYKENDTKILRNLVKKFINYRLSQITKFN